MAVVGFLFGAARSRVCEWVKAYQPVLKAVLGHTMGLPKRKITSLEEFVKAFPNVRKVAIDGTERPRARPKATRNSTGITLAKRNAIY